MGLSLAGVELISVYSAARRSSMSLDAGTRPGPHEILGPIGAGGIEVYRARDTSLKRDVALKTLPQSLATDSERLARSALGKSPGLAESPEHHNHLRARSRDR
jgi:hypothetical protein